MSGRMSPLIALLCVTILYSHNLDLADYGNYQSVWMYANIVSVILGFGITTIIFSTNAESLFAFIAKNKQQILSWYSALWISAIIIFLLFAKNFSTAQRIWISVFIVLQNANTILETIMIKNGGERKYFVVNVFYGLLFLGWHFFILKTGYALLFVITGIVCLSALKMFLLLLLRSKKQEAFTEPRNLDRSFTSHWIYVGLNDIVGIISKWADKLILLYLLTSSEFAIFFNGSIEIPFFGILISVTGSYMMLQMSKTTTDRTQIQSVFRESFLLLSSVVFPLFFFLFFFRYELFLIFFGKSYIASVPVFAISLLILPLRINDYCSILQSFSKGKKVTAGAVLDLAIAILLVFILYHFMGMQGAALAIVISTLIQSLYYLHQSAKVLHVKMKELVPSIRLLLRFLVTGAIFFLLKQVLVNINDFIAICIGIAVMLVIIAVMARKYLKISG